MSSLLVFLAVAGLLVVTPSPDMALVTRNALGRGRRAALLTALGIETGLLVWTGASVLGLAALLAASAFAFTAVKLAGAAYLVYLGLRTLLSLRGSATTAPSSRPSPAEATIAEGSPFQQGLLSNLLNPTIAVFFTSLIPQFVMPGPSATLESLALAGIVHQPRARLTHSLRAGRQHRRPPLAAAAHQAAAGRDHQDGPGGLWRPPRHRGAVARHGQGATPARGRKVADSELRRTVGMNGEGRWPGGESRTQFAATPHPDFVEDGLAVILHGVRRDAQRRRDLRRRFARSTCCTTSCSRGERP